MPVVTQIEYKIGDCLDLMRVMPEESVDLILTAPPFNVGVDYGSNTDDEKGRAAYTDWIAIRLTEMERLSKQGHPIIMFSGDINMHSVLDAVDQTGLTFHHFLKWHKPGCQRALSGFILFYRTELAVLLTKGKPDQSILNRRAVFEDTVSVRNNTSLLREEYLQVDHPCERPSSLYRHFINGFTNPGGLVLDPFLGSGTTLLACRQTGRSGLGFEINPEYEPMIRHRCAMDIPPIDSWGEVVEVSNGIGV